MVLFHTVVLQCNCGKVLHSVENANILFHTLFVKIRESNVFAEEIAKELI